MAAVEIIRGLAVAALMAAASAGTGAVVLAILGVIRPMGRRERMVWSFGLGSALLPCVIFLFGLAGYLQSFLILVVLVLAMSGLWWLRGGEPARKQPWSAAAFIVAAALAVSMAMIVVAAFAPPSDADTLSYHFDLPRQFIAAGKIMILPRAVEGAIPLLAHAGYTAAYLLGGEVALQAWVALTTLGFALLVLDVAQRYLPRSWAIAAAALMLTTPAIVYGGSSGQVEVRAAMFTMIAGFALERGVPSRDWRWAVVAGLAAGAYAATKLFGLFFLAASGVAVLLLFRQARAVIGFSLAALAVALPFFLAVWAETGDPFFPALFPVIGSPSGLWNAEIQAAFQTTTVAPEKGVPANLFWMLAYPFKATLSGLPSFESGRTGFGPVILLLLPFAAIGVALGGKRILRHPLFPVMLVVALAYVAWFFFGQTQRLRHLLPLYPLLLLLVMVAVEWTIRQVTSWRWPVAGALVACLTIQLAGQALFTRTFLPVVAGVEPRTGFLARTVLFWDAASWANSTLSSGQRLLTPYRGFLYYLDVPYYYCNHSLQTLVDCRMEALDELRFYREARALGVTHVLTDSIHNDEQSGVAGMARRLVMRGCARVMHQLMVKIGGSRTLPGLGAVSAGYDIIELQPCAGESQK